MSVALTTYIDLEQALKKRLIQSWRQYAAEKFVAIRAAIADKKFDQARHLAGEIDLAEVGAKNKEWIKYTLLATAKFGAAVANPDKPLAVSVGTYENLLNRVYHSFSLYLTHAGTTRVYNRLMQSIADAETEAKTVKADATVDNPALDTPTKPDDGGVRFVKDFTSFANTGDAALQLISSLHSSRLAAWGFTAEAEVLGVSRYQLIAVLDNRTSDFCAMINGREFDVTDAREKLDEVLSAEDPEDLKTLQPWPDQDKESVDAYNDMSEDDLVDEGLMIPPFHPNCRTILGHIGKTYRLAKPNEDTGDTVEVPDSDIDDDEEDGEDPSDAEFDSNVLDTDSSLAALMAAGTLEEPTTADTFAEYGVTVDAKQVDFWNRYVGISPGFLFGLMSDVDPQDIFDEVIDAGLDVDVTAGEIGVSLDGPLAGDDTSASIHQIMDPITGTLYNDYIDIAHADPAEAEGFIRDVYTGLADVASRMDATDVVTDVSLGTVAEHAIFGFLPDQATWDTMRQDILDQLNPDGDLADLLEDLDEDQLDTVVGLLSSSDPKAVWALATLPWEPGGVPLADMLFEGQSFQGTLDTTDPEAMARYAMYFPQLPGNA